ncbi:TonB-dependent receptor [Perlabentimonas gracilis]|uniref:TonB-dependent receptor n=1 Tax=Perlabentimonas gracilis TaxID=2715279 RepID=UPI00140C1DE5|nr:TonB-dependent receptor [Perlabentimonas gracilis]NHB68184.1 TonB-dependent receptor [Perlabentimonas gracilis]
MRKITIIAMLSIAYLNSLGQTKTDANIFGHIISTADGEHIPFINVLVKDSRIGTITDASGHYILTNIPIGEHTLIVTGMGFETKAIDFSIQAKQTIEIDVEVVPTDINLDAIVITSSPTASGFRYQPDMSYMGEELQKRSEISFGEMLNNSPGVAMRSMGSTPARPVIRGMDGDRILVLENGERMGDISETSADHSIALDPLAASRVEVIRGPASLLYGSSALGGVINIMTTDIPDRWDEGSRGVFSLQGATMNTMGAGFGRYTYGDETWAATGRVAYRQSSDITTPDGVIHGTSMSNLDAAAGYGFKSKNKSGGLSFSLANQVYEIPEHIEIPEEGVEIQMQRLALQGRMNIERKGFFDKAQLRFNTSRMFQQEVEYEWIDEDRDDEVELEYEKYSLSSTTTLQHKPFGFFDRGAVGVNLHAHNMDVRGEDAYTPGEVRVNLGVFTFQEIPLSNKMRLQAGLRIDFQHTSAIFSDNTPFANGKRNALNYTGSLGFNHRPIDGLEVGGQFARSHRNPSVEELYANGVHLGAGVYEIGNINLKDEIGQGGDFFIRWTSEIIDVELASFVNVFRNYIIFEPTGNFDPESGYPIFQYSGDEASLMGAELSAKLRPFNGFEIGLGSDFVDGRRITNGKEYLPFIPPFRITASVEYDFKAGWIGANMVSAAKQDRVAPDEEETDGYTIVGLSAGYRLSKYGRHVLILRVDNLLNQRYRDHLSRIEDRNFPMPGRNISLAYRWFF